ncbi:unnamed protein product [Cyprideis torosa]|uniref:DNA oxidative demethylase ALKBH2 n=1 Tax=Cyprideis torosa TaxID=163714 RepID=A0A7R8W7S6_9CRUS|nr:unnamed protein product [Cyprideis torosa]CAG0885491.1 unnamed protein product [Cyprideis torosa]
MSETGGKPQGRILNEVQFTSTKRENLHLLYAKNVLSKPTSFFVDLEKQVKWNTGDLAKVKLFGKWHNIPRKQAAYGDEGLSYRFSGNTIPAKPWIPCLQQLRDELSELLQHNFNFVLINRYKDGQDHIGYHKDDERELDPDAPIISISLGQGRDFLLQHQDSRGQQKKRDVPQVSILLEPNSMLLMMPPTNQFWFHSLPVRKSQPGVRINLTFRVFKPEIAMRTSSSSRP